MPANTLKLSFVAALAVFSLAACAKGDKKADADAAANTPAAAPADANVAMTNTPAVTPTVAPATATTTPGATTTTAAGAAPDAKAAHKAMKEACAADTQKFCASADKPGKCLKEHESELSPACSSARTAFKAARKDEKSE